MLREAKSALDLDCEAMRRKIETLSDAGNQMNKEHALYKTEKNKETSGACPSLSPFGAQRHTVTHSCT